MGVLDRTCENCGSGTGSRAFVPYEPAPNGAQQETDWSDDLPELRGFVCTDCGNILGVIDVRDPEELPDPNQADQFRVDEELR